MNTPFPESSHSAPCRCTSDASAPPLCSICLVKSPVITLHCTGGFPDLETITIPTNIRGPQELKPGSQQRKEIYLTSMLPRFNMFQYFNFVKVYINNKDTTCPVYLHMFISVPSMLFPWSRGPADRKVSKSVCSYCTGAVLCQKRLGVERTVYMFSCRWLQTFREAAASKKEGQVLLMMKAGGFPGLLVCQQRIQSQDR